MNIAKEVLWRKIKRGDILLLETQVPDLENKKKELKMIPRFTYHEVLKINKRRIVVYIHNTYKIRCIESRGFNLECWLKKETPKYFKILEINPKIQYVIKAKVRSLFEIENED